MSDLSDLIVTSLEGKPAFSFIAKGNKFKAVLPKLIHFENLQAKKLRGHVVTNPDFYAEEISAS